MRLSELIPSSQPNSPEIGNLAIDSRAVQPGDLFIAMKGGTFDGHDYIDEAIKGGAVAVLSERTVETPSHIINIVAPELIQNRNQLASRFYGDPSSQLTCIGTTGTNGKTSVTHGLASTLPAAGFLGSLGVGVIPNIEPTGLTTVDGVLLQRELASFKKKNLRYAAIEVSSHALDQGRVSDIQFDIGVFTNLTRDHLDYHKTMKSYGAIKLKLFTDYGIKSAVINIDDAFGQHIATECEKLGVDVITYGLNGRAQVRWSDISFSRRGLSGMWSTYKGDVPMSLKAPSEFAVYNFAAVLATMLVLGYDIEAAAHRISQSSLPPGRMEMFGRKHSPRVVVDFAHSPDALSSVLRSLRKFKPRELVCVFGCGGNRDKGKRKNMGEAVSLYADRSFITNDNPRNEDPECIANSVESGMEQDHPHQIILDRSRAIEKAIETSTKDDLVLVAGKGAEMYQEINGQQFAFSDREVVKTLLEEY